MEKQPSYSDLLKKISKLEQELVYSRKSINEIKDTNQLKLLQNLDSLWNLAKKEYETINELTDIVLNKINQISDSEHSFYGFINDDETIMTIYSWSKKTMKGCNIIDKPIDFEIEKAGLWAEAIRCRKTVVYNDYSKNIGGKKGLPDGHVKLTRLISIPILQHGKIVAIAAVANKRQDYTDEDVKMLESFLYNAQIIANQKLLEEKQKKERFYLKKAQEIGSIGTWHLDIKNNILTWTEENYKIFEVTPGTALTYEKFLTYVHPDDREYVGEEWEAAVKGKPYDIEHRLLIKGKVKWVREKAELEFNEDGDVVMAVGVTQDITKQKLSEQKIKEQQLLFETMFNTIQEGVVITNTKREILLANKGMKTTFGYKPEDVIGKSTEVLYSNNSKFKQAGSNIYDKNAKGKEGEYRTYYKRKNNEIFPGETFGAKLFNTDGEWIGNLGIMRDISDRVKFVEDLKRAKDEAVKNEQRLKIAQEASKSGAWDWDIVNNTFYWPDELINLFGFSPKDEFGFETWRKAVHPDDVGAANKRVSVAIETHTNLVSDYRIIKPDNTIRWIRTYGKTFYDNDKPLRMVGLCIDITTQKQHENELIEARKKAEEDRKLLDIQKRKIELNNNRLEGLLRISQLQTESTQEFLDYALKEAIELTESKIGYIYFYDENTKKFILNTWSTEVMKECRVLDPQTTYDLDSTGCWGEVVRQRSPIIINDYEAENPLKKGTPEGHVKLKRFLSIPVIFDEKIVAVAGVANKKANYDKYDVRQLTLLMDTVWKIAERIELVEKLKIAKEKTEKSEQNYKLIFNSTGTANSIFNKQGILENQNQLSIDQLGQDGRGLNVFELFDEKVGQVINERMQRVFATGKFEVFETEFKLPTGSKWFRSTYQPMFNEKHEVNFVQVVSQEITEIKKYQVELEKHKNQLEELVAKRTIQLEKTLKDLKATETQLIQSEKMSSLGVLTAGVAHEINNPLNYIQSGIYGLKAILNKDMEPQSLSGKVEEITNIMQVGVRRAASIVKSLNTFSRKGAGEKKKCNIHTIIDNCLLILNHKIENKCTIIKEYANEGHFVNGREENLHQVFTNLIMNAIQAIVTNGKIKVATKLKAKENKFEIVISDTGEGISKENLKKVFDPFFTTKDPGKGTGLGLSIVYKIIKEHQGTIKFESVPKKGTDVIINLPIS